MQRKLIVTALCLLVGATLLWTTGSVSADCFYCRANNCPKVGEVDGTGLVITISCGPPESSFCQETKPCCSYDPNVLTSSWCNLKAECYFHDLVNLTVAQEWEACCENCNSPWEPPGGVGFCEAGICNQ